MNRAVALLVLILFAGCTSTNVVQLGANRFRATAENTYTAAQAEVAALEAANAHCARLGRRMEAEVARSDTQMMYFFTGRSVAPASYGSGAVNFICI
ncbi:hypothetical protein [Sabulicella glaciei]|uniref:Lipoprotein n=1 Tax=Sabulicella glaciei TaxID=2984948 RepID=A0ABT3NWS0_9PROT|nr:hypothetical protein [Roseococcus sp. MDT2-1-1]MCW8086605.1 hypothetical protein [Roseococcus sp. MDT2-1-1]